MKQKFYLCWLAGVTGILLYIRVLYPSKSDVTSFRINSSDSTVTHLSLQRISESLFVIQADTYAEQEKLLSTRWPLPYPVFQFTQGDVNGDGIEDILVGVIKTTRFDPVKRKRIFIFKLFEGYVRPLWLGSRVAHPLVDFQFVNEAIPHLIRTIEQEFDGSYLIAEYQWQGFGLQFTQYLKRNATLEQARILLEQSRRNEKYKEANFLMYFPYNSPKHRTITH